MCIFVWCVENASSILTAIRVTFTVFSFLHFTAHRFLYLLFSLLFVRRILLLLPTYIFLVLVVFIISVFRWHRYVVNGILSGMELVNLECVCARIACYCCVFFIQSSHTYAQQNAVLFMYLQVSALCLSFTRSFQCTIDLVDARIGYFHLMFLC